MKTFPENFFHLICTSPPYNVKIEGYKDDLTKEEHEEFTKSWITEAYRVLVPGGRICINVANTGRRPYKFLNKLIVEGCVEAGFLARQEFIWHKGHAVAAGKTSWGTWRDCVNPITRDCHEYILCFNKPSQELDSKGNINPYKMNVEGFDPPDITSSEFAIFTFSVWEFKPARSKHHKAIFPEELPYRCIMLYTRPGMYVLDPFTGIGTTPKVAFKTGRHFVGIDTEIKYLKIAKKNIAYSRRLDDFMPEFMRMRKMESRSIVTLEQATVQERDI